ncbi:MAG: alpha/beta hydrolase [Clostridia bacterium]|nr:alpha/beta hydrolase [Clostridia bacterium]
MITDTKSFQIPLLADRPLAYLIAYVAGKSAEMPHNEKRKAMLIIPGGAYWMQSDAEADPVAHTFLAAGYNTFILRYSVGRGVDSRWPWPLVEASAAVKYIRDHADELCIDPDYVFVSGFSAGGHLAAALGTLWDNDEIEQMLGMEKGYNRPTGTILSYPVISGLTYAHRGSINNILRADRDDEEARRSVSLELHVTEKTAPAFLWATRTDEAVPVQNTLLYAKALADAGVPFEMHIYPRGPHALSIGKAYVGCPYPEVAAWTADAIRWMESIRPNATKNPV